MLKPLIVSISVIISFVLLLLLFCANCFDFEPHGGDNANFTNIKGKSSVPKSIIQYAPILTGRCGQRLDTSYSARIVGGHTAAIEDFP